MTRRFALLLTGLAFVLCGFRAPPEGAYQGPGSPAPDAVLRDVGGKAFTLSEALGGWTVLKFGTTWCPRCETEVDVFNALAPELRARAVRVVEVFLRESAEVVQQEVSARPRRYEAVILLDPDGRTIPLYGVSVIPRLFWLDPEGTVRVDTTFQNADQVRRTLERLMVR